jgi:hypothetical protein
MSFGLGFYKVGGSTSSTSTPEEYVRPSDWLSLPTVNIGEQKIVALVSLFQNIDVNLFSIRCTGAFTVRVYGLNNALVSSTNYASGIQAQLNLDYGLSSFVGTESSAGYRQAIIEIVPQAGQNLTSVQLHERHALGGTQLYSTNWLDMRVAGSLMSTFTLRGSLGNATNITIPRSLEQFEWVGSSSISNFSNMFLSCLSLRNVIGTEWTASGTTFSNMFSGCSNLKTIPLLNTANGTIFSTMFSNCSSLQTIPLLNTANGTTFASMFQSCSNLKTIPLLNTANGTTFSSMFNNCSSLQTIPLLNTANGTIFTSMFSGCSSLQTIPLLNTASGTTFTSMFQSCLNLQTIPLLNTANGTTFNSMFNNCSNLKTIPLLNTINGTAFTNMFQSCLSLQTIPDLNIVQVSSSANWGTAVFSGCPSLQRCNMYLYKFSTSFANCFLNKDDIVNIFYNLATTTGQTITISGNRGASLLSTAERAIATDKGWTISG